MAKFTYRGEPIRDEYGNVIAVQPTRSFPNGSGRHFPGIKSEDAFGNTFTYNQVPNDEGPTPIITLFFLHTLPRRENTHYKILAEGLIEANKVVMA